MISETVGWGLSYHGYANSKERVMKRLRPGWYNLLYHDISWEENCYLKSIGGTCPPDLFRQHMRTLSTIGELVSVEEGEKRLREHAIDVPIFSLWFDDGLAGVRKYALPILEQFGVTGAAAICSRFLNRSEFFWRFKLSYLNSADGMRFLRSRLQKHGYKRGDSGKRYTLDNFSLEIVAYIDELFNRFTTPAQREDAFRMFMDRDAVQTLLNMGWIIANHTAAHYPISQEHSLNLLAEEFQECEAEIESICHEPSDYWVLPFNSSPETVSIANSYRGDRYLVFVDNRINTPELCNSDRILYRIGVQVGYSQGLMDSLERVQSRN